MYHCGVEIVIVLAKSLMSSSFWETSADYCTVTEESKYYMYRF
jgi:hypothetical protein